MILLPRNISEVVVLGLIFRVIFLALGAWLDRDIFGLGLRYTDVDYDVFSDAAGMMYEGGSPYDRPTYRYPPVIALLLVLNHTLGIEMWGKVLFSVSDAALIKLIYDILLERGSHYSSKSTERDNPARHHALWWATMWAFNPLSTVICTRGSCDSLSNFLVLQALYGVVRGRRTSDPWRVGAAGAALGLAVHVRMYPVIYILAFMFYLSASEGPEKCAHDKKQSVSSQRLYLPVIFLLATAGSVIYFTVASMMCSGSAYTRHSVLYHLQRLDHRHNFSVRWFGNYLQQSVAVAGSDVVDVLSLPLQSGEAAPAVPCDGVGAICDVLLAVGEVMRAILSKFAGSFAPQAILMLFSAIYIARRNLCVCLFVQTMIFVAFNGIVTAQYFTWYLCLVPLIFPLQYRKQLQLELFRENAPIAESPSSRGLWYGSANLAYASVGVMAAMCLWLYNAYRLEIKGDAVHTQVWLCSCVFHVAQVAAVVVVIQEFL